MHQRPDQQVAAREAPEIEIAYGGDDWEPFICAVRNFDGGIDDLVEIQAMLQPDQDDYYQHGEGVYLVRPEYFEGQHDGERWEIAPQWTCSIEHDIHFLGPLEDVAAHQIRREQIREAFQERKRQAGPPQSIKEALEAWNLRKALDLAVSWMLGIKDLNSKGTIDPWVECALCRRELFDQEDEKLLLLLQDKLSADKRKEERDRE